MEHNEILNPNEGKTVDNIVWPFYRYSALIPKQIGADLFVWLYLSLVILQNRQKGLSKDSYTDEVTKEVEIIILEKFSSVIDKQIFDEIKANAEKDFTVSTRLKEETFSFVDTYESLFSDKLDVKYIYRDAITGEVVPFFGDTSHIDDSNRRENAMKTRSGIKEPPKVAVKRAYEHYMRLKKYSSDSEEDEIQAEFDELFFDEDAQTFIDGDIEIFEEKSESKEQKSLKDYNVIFLKDSKVLFDVDVPVFVRGNELMLKSPFDRTTDQWFNRCAVKAQNISEDVAELFRLLKQHYIVAERSIGEFRETRKTDFASTLKYCDVIYRMIDTLNDDELRKDVVCLEQSFNAKQIVAYYYVGRILDTLVRDHIEYTGRTKEIDRLATTYDRFCLELDAKCQYGNIRYESLKRKGVFSNWQSRKNERADGKKNASFKADIADIVLKTDFIHSQAIYPSFFSDLFKLYDDRSKADHADRDAKVDPSMIQTLEKALKVLFQLI